jgi:hypothetical protein
MEGVSKRTSYVWPFYHTAEYYSTKEGGGGWLLWPIVGKNRFNRLTTWSFLWPFFSFYERTPNEKGEDDGFGLVAPWPVFQYKRNVDRDEDNEKWKFYLWPIYGRSERKNSKYNFILWPLGSSLDTFEDEGNVEWRWALPLYWSKHASDKKGNETEVYRRFWPFASYFSQGDRCEIRSFDIWPERNMPVIERNWTPLWIIFDYQREKEAFRYDFFWGWIKYFALQKKGSGFSIFPFYSSRYDLPAESGVGEEVTEKTDLRCDAKRVEREYLMGLVKTINGGDDSFSLRLLWLIEF